MGARTTGERCRWQVDTLHQHNCDGHEQQPVRAWLPGGSIDGAHCHLAAGQQWERLHCHRDGRRCGSRGPASSPDARAVCDSNTCNSATPNQSHGNRRISNNGCCTPQNAGKTVSTGTAGDCTAMRARPVGGTGVASTTASSSTLRSSCGGVDSARLRCTAHAPKTKVKPSQANASAESHACHQLAPRCRHGTNKQTSHACGQGPCVRTWEPLCARSMRAAVAAASKVASLGQRTKC